MTATAVVTGEAGLDRPPRTLARRLRPLQLGVALQGLMLWVSVEKLFQTEIGFDAASIGVVAAAYAIVVPLLEVPSGILADRSSRSGLMIAAGVAAAASALAGGLSTGVASYVVAAGFLGVFFALSSGTVDSIVYDVVLEETGTSAAYEHWIGRVLMVQGAALATSALAGGVLAGWASPRVTYLATVPLALGSTLAFARFDEPRLHRAAEPVALRQHLATTFRIMTRDHQVRRIMLLAAVTALLSQAVFEFGPLWLVALDAPAASFGPYWAVLVATTGLGGYLASKVSVDRARWAAPLAIVLVAATILLATSSSVPVVAVAQAVVLLALAIVGIHAGLLLHDAVPSTVRSGVSSGVGTFSWIVFLPFSMVFGRVLDEHGLHPAGWVLVAAALLLVALVAVSNTRRRSAPTTADTEPTADAVDPSLDPDVACRELVALVSDYVDGILPANWREAIDHHLRDCDGCAAYLAQIRATVDLLEELAASQRPTTVQD